MVTARFKVSRVSPMGDAENPWAYEVELTPDYANGANKDWSEATPSGMCRLTITNKAAVEHFVLGTPYELQFCSLND
jgi:hypothetical protein